MAKFRKVKNNRKNSPTRGMIYGRAVVNRVVHTSAIAKKITERCTVTEPDILAVINALMTEISANIAEGNKVVLDEFGSFKLGIRTSPAVNAKKFTSANIKNMYVIYSPYSVMDQGKRVKPMLSGIKMEEMTEYNGIEDEENGGGTTGGGTSGEINFEYKPMGDLMMDCCEQPMTEKAYDLDIEPDDIDVSDTVTVVWEIE